MLGRFPLKKNTYIYFVCVLHDYIYMYLYIYIIHIYNYIFFLMRLILVKLT